MNQLFKPNKLERSLLNRGLRKVRIRNMKLDKKIEPGTCEYCQKDVYHYVNQDRMMTLTGSDHKCRGFIGKQEAEGLQ